jgi:hypothetical protein
MSFGDVDTIKLAQATTIPGFYVTNCIYTYNSMKYGDSYAGKPFETGDYLKLIIYGIRDNVMKDSVEFYLGTATKLVDEWTYVDLTALKEVDGITFKLIGTRMSYGYLNTPAYFAFDNLGAKEQIQ